MSLADTISLAAARLEFASVRRKAEDVSHIQSVCLVLGPYRNLTTLTASLAFLHPNVQVLNHGATRIMPLEGANFFEGYTDEKFDDFVRYALHLSEGGKRGKHGGSITLAHAFQNNLVQKTYEARYGNSTLKQDIRCMFWKESMRVTNILREESVDLDDLLARNSRLCFILPVRNPIDSAISNRKVGHVKHFHGLVDDTLEATIDYIIREIAWFLGLQKKHPGRFFHYLQDDMHREKLSELAEFLRIPADEKWIDDCLHCWQIKPSYEVEDEVREHARACAKKRLADYPAVRDMLIETL